MNKALKYLTSWSFIGLVFSILGTISLFGELGVITFSEWLNNVIDAYQLLVYPLFKLIFSPLLTVLDLDIDSWEIDLIVIVFFFLNRFLADMVAYAFLQILKNDTPAKEQRSLILGVKYRSARRILVYFYKLGEKLSKYNIMTLAIIRNLVLLSALILLTKIFSGIEVSRPERVEVLHIVIFFAALYVFPLFNLAVILFFLAIGGAIYLINYIFYLARSAPKPKLEDFNVLNRLRIFKSQAIFCFQFTFGFLLIIGVNYKYLQ